MDSQNTFNLDSHLNVFSSVKIYDLSTTISPDTTVFPGAAPISSEPILSLKEGHVCGLSKMTCSNHTGTHIDYPLHLFENAKSSSNYKLEDLRGRGRIIEVPESQKSITKEFIQGCEIKEQEIIFFKTSNSKIPKKGPFNPNFVYIEPSAAEEIVLRKPKMIGIDYLSIDSYQAHDLPSHKILLSKQILLVQGLELNEVPTGVCYIQAVPMNVANMDGLPARILCHF